jgi:hypothetical protein
MSVTPHPAGATPAPDARDVRIGQLERDLGQARAQVRTLTSCLAAAVGKLEYQDAELAKWPRRWGHTLAWFANPHIKPGEKVLGFNVYAEMGGAPGEMPNLVLSDERQINVVEMGRRSGMGETAARSAFATLVQNGVIPARTEKVPPPAAMIAGKPEDKVPPFITVTKVQPPSGPDAPILNPAKIGPLEPSQKRKKEAARSQQRNGENKTNREIIKTIMARCPGCGCTDPAQLGLVCHKCGVKTLVEEMPSPKKRTKPVTPRFIRKEEPHPVDAEGQDTRPRPTRPQPQQQELFEGAGPETLVTNTPGPEMLVTNSKEVRNPYISPGSETLVTNTSSGPVPETLVTNTSSFAKESDVAKAAAALMLDVFGGFEQHILMLQGRRTTDGRKYTTIEAPLDQDILYRHLTGDITVGGRLSSSTLATPSRKRTRALAWDTDSKAGWRAWTTMVQAAHTLAGHGLKPLLVRNPAKEASGHLWLLLDGDMDAGQAQLAAETLAPGLKQMGERFPDLTAADGRRIRFPAGVYRAEDGTPVPVMVALESKVGDTRWHEGTSPEAWTDILGALSDHRILECTHVPVADVPKPQLPERRTYLPRSGQSHADIQAWCVANPIDSQVSIEAGNKFRLRNEGQPSVHFYRNEGRFYDFGDDRYQGDAFDLFMILNKFWDPEKGPAREVADYKGALRAAGIAREGASTKDEAPSEPLPLADDDKWDYA